LPCTGFASRLKVYGDCYAHKRRGNHLRPL
jgi:hypothetical protein